MMQEISEERLNELIDERRECRKLMVTLIAEFHPLGESYYLTKSDQAAVGEIILEHRKSKEAGELV